MPVTSATAAREAARQPNGRFGVQERPEADMTLTIVPAPVRYDSLEAIAAAGYVTDEWERWQQGYCAAYAVALIEAHPHLRYGVMGETELGGGDASEGWRESHVFAHDDQYAYDSAGRHPLPYLGVEGDCDYAELGGDPDDWGDRDDFDEDTYAAARAHADKHQILMRAPVPYGGVAR